METLSSQVLISASRPAAFQRARYRLCQRNPLRRSPRR
jgi:hypothetical protein